MKILSRTPSVVHKIPLCQRAIHQLLLLLLFISIFGFSMQYRSVSATPRMVGDRQTVPGGTIPGGTIPGGTVPGGTIPGEPTVPGGTIPPTQTPGSGGTIPPTQTPEPGVTPQPTSTQTTTPQPGTPMPTTEPSATPTGLPVESPTALPTDTPIDQKISLTVNVDKEKVVPGDLVVFELRVNNLTNQFIKGVILEVVVPEHALFSVEGSTAGWQKLESSPLTSAPSLGYLAACPSAAAAGTRCQYGIDVLPAGQSATIRYAVRVEQNVPANATLDLAVSINGQKVKSGNTKLDIASARLLYLSIIYK